MKIKSPTEAATLIRPTKERPKREFSEFMQQQHDQQKSQEQREELAVSEDRVNQAIDAFANDPQTQANGIQATATGTGPGLRVVLKDGSGAVIRQLSGEEFVRLREELSGDSHSRGKILDQKL